MEKILCVLIGYCFGVFQSSYVFIRHFYGVDIRNVGSGNAGTTNVLMNFGKPLALLVLFCDMMKTIVPVIICTLIFRSTNSLTVTALTCLGVAVGHNFPFWLKFKGGKGVAVAVATTLVLDVRIFIVAILTAAVFSALTKSLTYGSHTFAIMMFICAVTFGYAPIVAFSILIQSLLINFLHIKRKKAVAH
ncbi:MAG: glycerol-3-phosphate acyltransferase [Ruminococcus sp.]|nr:glycerol-3-phosphate acyltransferase [Ruminococcus sp.]